MKLADRSLLLDFFYAYPPKEYANKKPQPEYNILNEISTVMQPQHGDIYLMFKNDGDNSNNVEAH